MSAKCQLVAKSEIAALCVHKMFADAGLPQEIDLRESGRETCVEPGVKGGWHEQCQPMQPSCVGILGQAGNETIAASLIAGLIVVPM